MTPSTFNCNTIYSLLGSIVDNPVPVVRIVKQPVAVHVEQPIPIPVIKVNTDGTKLLPQSFYD